MRYLRQDFNCRKTAPRRSRIFGVFFSERSVGGIMAELVIMHNHTPRHIVPVALSPASVAEVKASLSAEITAAITRRSNGNCANATEAASVDRLLDGFEDARRNKALWASGETAGRNALLELILSVSAEIERVAQEVTQPTSESQ
jgi:hypothetical protein